MAPPDPAYVVDPKDPRAPSEEAWARLSPAERARVVSLLPPAEKHLAAEAAVAEERKRADAAEAEKQLLAARLAEALAELEKLRGR